MSPKALRMLMGLVMVPIAQPCALWLQTIAYRLHFAYCLTAAPAGNRSLAGWLERLRRHAELDRLWRVATKRVLWFYGVRRTSAHGEYRCVSHDGFLIGAGTDVSGQLTGNFLGNSSALFPAALPASNAVLRGPGLSLIAILSLR
ncbi:MAG: hypothetical protein E6R08_02985 [Nevskiaceae bacterium]|nr:MAG: hypothetical protein E6R08_02985 [Nevskiaceae bacterium]